MYALLLVPVALLVGLALGWVVGRKQARAEVEAYKAGVADAHQRALEGRGGVCWIKGRVEALERGERAP